MSKLGALLHSEIVGLYSGMNSVLAALVVLNVVHWTPDQIAAAAVILNTVLGPIVRGLVTPTAVRGTTQPTIIMRDVTPGPPTNAPTGA